jgi:hypothetical protein
MYIPTAFFDAIDFRNHFDAFDTLSRLMIKHKSDDVNHFYVEDVIMNNNKDLGLSDAEIQDVKVALMRIVVEFESSHQKSIDSLQAMHIRNHFIFLDV